MIQDRIGLGFELDRKLKTLKTEDRTKLNLVLRPHDRLDQKSI